MKENPDRSANAGNKLSKKNTSLLLSAFISFAASAPSIPSEEDCLNLANELEKNPPAELTPNGLSIVTKILRGEYCVKIASYESFCRNSWTTKCREIDPI
jgi:hypothetical protein